jgi:hypothetical protein
MHNKRVVIVVIVIVAIVVLAGALIMVGPGLLNAMIAMHGGR